MLLENCRRMINTIRFFILKKQYYECVLIYQMGKVGSSSIKVSLEQYGYPCYHTHSHLDAANYLKSNSKTLVLTSVRELISRNISAFFQNIDNPDNPWWYIAPQEELVTKYSVQTLIKEFKGRQKKHLDAVVFPWFFEFNEVTGVDILNREFDKEYGIMAIENVLFMRLESIDNAIKYLNQNTNITIELIKANEAKDKWYSNIYDDFKKRVNFDEDEISMYYDNQIMQSFYSAQEIEVFKNRWSGKEKCFH